MSDNVTSLPEQVDFDLDVAEKPDALPPFRPKVGGRVLTMNDPQDIDWQDALDVENPLDMLAYCMSDEDREYLYGLSLKSWQLGTLLEAFSKHFQLEGRLKDFQRKQRHLGVAGRGR